MSLPARWMVIGAAAACAIGGFAGLLIGLSVHPATAWFAVFELGVPAGVAGGVVGLFAGLLVAGARRLMG